jgi:hypothetical protein
MPNYKGHLVGGAVTFVIVSSVIKYWNPTLLNSYQDIFTGLIFCALGSLFPDIDIKSMGQRIFYLLVFPLVVLAIATKRTSMLSILSVVAIVPVLVRHRGIIHRWWFVVFMPLIVPVLFAYNHSPFFVPSIILYTFFVSGALSHVFLDYGFKRMVRRYR